MASMTAMPRVPLPYFIIALTVSFLSASCAKRSSPAETASQSQTLLLGNGAEPADLDPPTASAYTDMNVIMALFEGLTFIDEKSAEPVPAAAESWDTSPDGLTWTFHLRPTAVWSNGEPLVADDFVQSFRRVISPALALENASYLFALKNAEAINGGKIKDPTQLGATASDPHTLVLTLERPTPHLALLTALTPWYPINPRVLEKYGALHRRSTAWTRAGNLVGNGAFTLVEWAPNSRIVVKKNPRYWNAAQTTLERIEFFPIDNPETEERNFRAGQLHVTHSLPVTKVDAWRKRDAARLRLDPFLQTVFVMFNAKQPPFDDVRVRQAFALAIDREAISRTALAGGRPPAYAATPPNTGGFTARTGAGYDVEEAKKLLAAAGHAGGQGLPPLAIQVRNDEIQPTVAEALQSMWQRALGVQVGIVPLEQKTWLQNQRTLNYTLSTYSWVGDFPDPITFLGNFASTNGNNWTGWANAPYDTLVDEASVVADSTHRQELFQQAEALLATEVPLTPVYHGAQTYLIQPSVENWVPTPLGSRRYQLVRLVSESRAAPR